MKQAKELSEQVLSTPLYTTDRMAQPHKVLKRAGRRGHRGQDAPLTASKFMGMPASKSHIFRPEINPKDSSFFRGLGVEVNI